MMTRVLYPGSFDPIHNGHVEIISTAARLFDEVIVAAVDNPQKSGAFFALEERRELIDQCFEDRQNVSSVLHTGLVVELARTNACDFIIKGLRAVSDFESELQMAQLNHELSGIDTVFLPSTSSSSFIASKYVREIARLGGDVTSMVPVPVWRRMHAMMVRSD